jgi:general secretion pathway protein I
MNTLTFLSSEKSGNGERTIPRVNRVLPGSRDRGFTLLEVLVAVVILGTALTVLLGAVNKNLILASRSKNLTIAGILAQEKLTEIELEGYPQPREEKGEFEGAPGFNWFLSIKPFEISELGIEIRTVRLLITWDEGKESLEVTMAISDLG